MTRPTKAKGMAGQVPVYCEHTAIWPLAKFKPNPGNPNRHPKEQIKRLATIIQGDGNGIPGQGWRNPIVVSTRSGLVVKGHGRLEAALAGQMQFAPVDLQPYPSKEAEQADLIADNVIAELSEMDEKLMASMLKELEATDFKMELTGFDTAQVEKLLRGDEIKDTEPKTGQAEALKKKWRTKTGQLWQLGKHRLLCGDCRSNVSKLLKSEKINIAFTSPPYASQREYDESSGFKPIPPDEFVQWFKAVQKNVKECLASDGSWFVNIKPSADGLDTSLYVFDLVIAHVREWGWHFATEFCWQRNGVPKSVSRRFKNQFEPIYQFALGDWKMRPEAVQHPSENVPIPFGKGAGNTSWANQQGGNGPMFGGKKRGSKGRPMSSVQGTKDSCFEKSAPGMAYPGNRLPAYTETHEALGHTAAFPVGLPTFFIKAYTDTGDIIYDPFLGSGTTLIACENLQRQCRAIEISPVYVAVALDRWARHTNKMPFLIMKE